MGQDRLRGDQKEYFSFTTSLTLSLSIRVRVLNRLVERRSIELKPIERDDRTKDKIYYCVKCSNVATQIAFIKVVGATVLESFG
jgi:hypothetical protein